MRLHPLLAAFVVTALPASVWAAGAPTAAFDGANPLGAPRPEFAAAQVGMDLIYKRQYAQALQHFEVVGVDFPESPLGPVGRGIVWQAMMWEEGDFARDRAWQTEVSEVQARQRIASRQAGDPSWYQFLDAVHLALAAMYEVRHENNLSALNKAWDAMELVKKIQRAHPDFHDLQLAFGLYNYWRTVYTERIPGLPNFGDKRAEGIQQMTVARDKGLLAPAPARLALVFTWLDSKELDKALAESKATYALYPTNVLNGALLGRIQERSGDNAGARATFEALTQASPEAWEPWYRLARNLARDRASVQQARSKMSIALARARGTFQTSRSAYYMALLERDVRRYDSAIQLLEQAAAADPTWAPPTERLATLRVEADRWAERQEERLRATDARVKERAY